MKNCIYALRCPITNEIHYVGKSTRGVFRPLQHISKSHSDKIREWVDELKIIGYKPIISILEECESPDFLDDKELFWISKCIKDGCVLLNKSLVTPATILVKIQNGEPEPEKNFPELFKTFLKNKRKSVKLTQREMADKMGFGLRWLREAEQGEISLMLPYVIKALNFWGYTLTIKRKNEYENKNN